MAWTTEQKAFVVEAYFRLNSIRTVQLEFKTRFKCLDSPSHQVMYLWIKKFRNHHTLKNLNAKEKGRQSHLGRPKTARTPVNICAVRNSVVASPKKSLRRRSQELGISCASVRRILVKDLNLHAYRIQISQKLTAEDMRKRLIMCKWFSDKIGLMPDFLDNLWFSTKHFFCCQVMSTQRTMSFREAHHLTCVFKSHCTP